MLTEVNECEIVYSETGVRNVHTFHRMMSYAEEAVASDFKQGKMTPLLLIAEHRITQAKFPDVDENRQVMAYCDGVRFIVNLTILPDRKYYELGEFSRFEVNDTTMLEKLVRSLTRGKQEEFWNRIRHAIEIKKG